VAFENAEMNFEADSGNATVSEVYIQMYPLCREALALAQSRSIELRSFFRSDVSHQACFGNKKRFVGDILINPLMRAAG
jgi:hypothetical protein